MDLLGRLRPGSGHKAPVSETMGPDRKRLRERPRPQRGIGDKPGGSPDGFNPATQSWPVVIGTDVRGRERTNTPHDSAEETARRLEEGATPEAEEWVYEPDDPEVLRKLFGIKS